MFFSRQVSSKGGTIGDTLPEKEVLPKKGTYSMAILGTSNLKTYTHGVGPIVCQSSNHLAAEPIMGWANLKP